MVPETTTALGLLILSARLAGVDAVAIPPSPTRTVAATARAEEPRAVLKLPLQDIVRDQERAYAPHPVGRGTISFSVGLDPAGLWIKLRQQDRCAAHALAELERGVEESFPVEPYRFLYENGLIRALPVWEPREPQANVTPGDLLQRLYDAAVLVAFDSLEYAVVYEDGSLAPTSVSLIREDDRGRRWLIHHKTDELKEVRWFVTLNAKSYGIRLEGEDLVFYSTPASPALKIEPEHKLFHCAERSSLLHSQRMRKYRFPVVIEQDEDGWYVGIVPDLKGCHTQAKTLSQLDARLKEAIRLCLEVEKGRFVQNVFIGVHQVEIAA